MPVADVSQCRCVLQPRRRTSKPEIVRRVCELVQDRRERRGGLGLDRVRGCLPARVQQLRKVVQRQALLAVAPAREVEDDRRLHRREQRVARAGDAVVEEVGLVDAPILSLSRRFADDATPEVNGSRMAGVGTCGTHRSIISISAVQSVLTLQFEYRSTHL